MKATRLTGTLVLAALLALAPLAFGATPSAIPDTQIAQKLAGKLAYERVGYGNVFNAIGASVDQGVVTLTGVARTPSDKAAYLDAARHTPGVTAVVDRMQVAPTSTFDDELRVRLARAIYGDSALERYAIDPAAPIRIVVENGHVALYGTVANALDRQIAVTRANEVPGAFSVDDNLQIAAARVR